MILTCIISMFLAFVRPTMKLYGSCSTSAMWWNSFNLPRWFSCLVRGDFRALVGDFPLTMGRVNIWNRWGCLKIRVPQIRYHASSRGVGSVESFIPPEVPNKCRFFPRLWKNLGGSSTPSLVLSWVNGCIWRWFWPTKIDSGRNIYHIGCFQK